VVLAERRDSGDVSATGAVADIANLPEHASGPRAYGWWGIVWLIGTEAMLFGALIASYFYIRFKSGPAWPPGDIELPKLELPLIMSAILWSSSIPVHIADRGIRSGSLRKLRWGLMAGFVLGATFLALQVGVEYPEKLREFSATENAYGSLFFTLTGMHGLHVIGGLMFSLWVQVHAWRRLYDAERHLSVQNFSLYWHFVDAVWAFVLGSLYLSPHL
jgi:heme/copper-type cytochrome/quinol oxidase subunit 3